MSNPNKEGVLCKECGGDGLLYMSEGQKIRLDRS